MEVSQHTGLVTRVAYQAREKVKPLITFACVMRLDLEMSQHPGFARTCRTCRASGQEQCRLKHLVTFTRVARLVMEEVILGSQRESHLAEIRNHANSRTMYLYFQDLIYVHSGATAVVQIVNSMNHATVDCRNNVNLETDQRDRALGRRS